MDIVWWISGDRSMDAVQQAGTDFGIRVEGVK